MARAAAGQGLKAWDWGLLGLLAVGMAGGLGLIAQARGEAVGAGWLLLAALCAYAIGYRYYSRFLARRVFPLDDARRTPAHVLEDGQDHVPTGRWVVFGHHFAAIAGAGPLVGPILAAQFGVLPGALWILIGVMLAGAVQDFVVMAASVRRQGRSLGQMVRDELGPVAGVIALVAILTILIILKAVLALVVVKALAASPWGTFTLAMTIPIALLVGYWMRVLRPGRVGEATAVGVGLLGLALVGGQWVAAHPSLGPLFTLAPTTLAFALMIYGFAASVLPVWLLLAPRDYLSTFVKVGTVVAMAVGVAFTLPSLNLPAFTKFIDGSGPVVAGPLFPFCFLTIACGAISGFHALVSSGTTPKLIDREGDVRLVGYGAMLMESFVAVMALIAAASLDPAVYFAINAPVAATGATPEAAAATVSAWGYPLAPTTMPALAQAVGETTLANRTGGAPTFALGMAEILARLVGGQGALGLWYHFAIMFEALFILTTIDAGTRVGRFLLQDLLGLLHAPLADTRNAWAGALASALVVGGWGWFLYQGVVDPMGGINTLWPLFGIANQLLAAIALALGTTVLLKMGRRWLALTTALPLAWVAIVTFSAGILKVFSTEPRVGFLAHRESLAAKLAEGALSPELAATAPTLMRNDLINAGLACCLMAMAFAVLFLAAHEWWAILRGKPSRPLAESPPVFAEAPTPAGAPA